jgi:hypothetical protein
MGTVYRAFDANLGREVALKLLNSTDPQSRALLKAEFRALSHLVHPNLVTLYELVADERSCFFTMELIAGTDFVAHLRSRTGPGASADFEHRFREAARQLALGLCALHADGKLHRDVKPSNVMVTEAARVVLLDFGLAVPLRPASSKRMGLAGTVLYMAPEQAWGDDLAPSADWYAFGVTLYEALTGRLPITGAPHNVIQAKTSFAPKSLRESGLNISPELDELLTGLLQPSPSRRPTGAKVLELLGTGGTSGRPRLAPIQHRDREHPLLGREPQLARLRALLDEVRGGAARIVTLEGQSGIGKTSIVRRFVEELDASSVLVLRSRCHPQETVAFNAVDGLVDELCDWLAESPTASDFFPESCDELCQLYPALARFAPSSGPETEPRPTYSRRHAFGQLRDLLRAVAEVCPLVLWLDDLQWGDEESGFLLREVLSSKDAPKILTIACVREEDRHHSACLRVLADSEVARLATRLTVPPLGEDHAIRLVRDLSDHPAAIEPTALADLVRQSRGSPFLLAELGRYLAVLTTAPDDIAHRGIGAVLGGRIEPLQNGARRALEVLAIAGAPLEQDTALTAAGLGDGYRDVYAGLERLFLVRTVDTRQRAVEVYHHQVRDVVLRGLPEGVRAERHRAIGRALVLSERPNVIAAIEHFEAGADVDSVRRYVVPAADEAARVLAFERAARLYQRALELGGSGTPLEEVERRLAVALASAGRGREAGEAYARAAGALERRSNADAQHVLELRYRAAEQFIQTGHDDKGSGILREVLERVGIPLPASRGEAIGKTVALRLSIMASELTNRTAPDRPSAADLWRFDAMRSACLRLAIVDHAVADYASARCMKDAMALGDVPRLVRALAAEATTWSHVPLQFCQRRGVRLLERASSLLPTDADPYDRAYLRASHGVAASFRGEFRQTTLDLASAIELLKAHSPVRAWEISLWRVWQLWALSQLGEFRELRRLTSEDLADAIERDDRFTERNATLGAATYAWLADDRPAELLRRGDALLRGIPPEYNSARWQYFLTAMDVELYQGRWTEAWARARSDWPQLRANGFLFLSGLRDDQLNLRARAALGAATQGARARRALRTLDPLDDALWAARRLDRNGLPMGRAWALLVRANVAKRRGDADESRRRLGEALLGFEAAGMAFYREVTRYCLGRMTGASEGARLVREAEDWMQREAIVNPGAMIRMAAPGFVE